MTRHAPHATDHSDSYRHLTRRQFMGRSLAAGAALTLAGTALGRVSLAQEQISGTVTFWRLSGAGFQGDVFDEAAKRLETKYPDVKVDTQQLQNDAFKTKLQVAMGSDSPPDVWHTWGGGVLAEYVNAGAVHDLTDELAKDGWKDTFSPAVLDLMAVDGKFYGVPIDASGVFFWYNKDIFSENNITPPETWDALLGVIETLKGKGMAPIALANKTKWPGAFYLNYLVDRVAGSDYLGEVVAGKASFNDPRFIEAGKRLQELVQAGAFPKGFNGLDWDTGGSRQLLYAKKSAMELMGSWLPSTAAGEMKGFDEKLDFFPVPVPPDGKGDPTSIVGGTGTAYAVSEKSKSPAAAVELLRYLTDTTTRDALAKGGDVPAEKGATITDPRMQKVAGALEKAAHLQLYWDQFLPPDLGQAQLDVTQGLLSMDMTPEEAAQKMDDVAKKASS
ncbi:MAG TPA: extracellular solute-binding protein [Thermomicrobiales bacterium]|nr:extracellular solute-binding protein [Thermomicrobiales bacterium]